jgi:hypothetical protein
MSGEFERRPRTAFPFCGCRRVRRVRDFPQPRRDGDPMRRGIRVEWTLLKKWQVPGSIRALVEARLLVLWRLVDCPAPPPGSQSHLCRSEKFKMDQDRWSFSYQLDLLKGVVIVSDAIEAAF